VLAGAARLHSAILYQAFLALAARPPFIFVKEHTEGSSPKVEVTDAKNDTWVITWGSEVKAEAFATRIAWACGYFADANYFVPKGHIDGAKHLHRAKAGVDSDGSFSDACFELREKNAKFLKNNGWTWENIRLSEHQS
jgi:hypothetical protein